MKECHCFLGSFPKDLFKNMLKSLELIELERLQNEAQSQATQDYNKYVEKLNNH